MRKNKSVAFFMACVLIGLGMHSNADSTKVERIQGQDRYQTAIEVSKSSYDKSEKVLLVSGENYADAISAANISIREKMPILLAKGDTMYDQLSNELNRLGVKEVIIVGGNSSVSAKLQSDLSNKYKVTRISGENREKTSIGVYNYLSKNSKVESIGISNGYKFSDALAATPYINEKGGVLVLSNSSNLDKELDSIIKNKKLVLFGGERSLSKGMDNIENTERIAGANKYETANLIGEKYSSIQGKTLDSIDNVILTNGEKYADALTSVSLSSKYKAPILFSNNNTLEKLAKRANDKKVIIVGGEKSVTKNEENIINNISEKVGSNSNKDENKDNTGSYKIKKHKSNRHSNRSTDKEMKEQKSKVKNEKIDKDVEDNKESVKDVKKEYIKVPDKLFLKVLNKNIDLNRADDQKITKEDMLKLKQLSVYESHGQDITNIQKDSKRKSIIPQHKINEKFMVSRGLKSIEGIQYAKNLEAIEISECEIADITPLKDLKKIKYIEVDRNRITDVTPLAGLTNLEHLKLYNNLIEDISPLKTLTKLKYLDVHFNTDNEGKKGITNIDVVKNFKNLELLDVSANHIKNIDVLADMDKITITDFSGNNISDYSKLGDIIYRIYNKQFNEGVPNYSVGFFGQSVSIDKTFNVPAQGGEIRFKSPYKGINELAGKLFGDDVKTFFMEFKGILKPPTNREENINVFEDDDLINSYIDSIAYDINSDEFVVKIKPNTTGSSRTQNLGIRVGADAYVWNIFGIGVVQEAAKKEVKNNDENNKDSKIVNEKIEDNTISE